MSESTDAEIAKIQTRLEEMDAEIREALKAREQTKELRDSLSALAAALLGAADKVFSSQGSARSKPEFAALQAACERAVRLAK